MDAWVCSVHCAATALFERARGREHAVRLLLDEIRRLDAHADMACSRALDMPLLCIPKSTGLKRVYTYEYIVCRTRR